MYRLTEKGKNFMGNLEEGFMEDPRSSSWISFKDRLLLGILYSIDNEDMMYEDLVLTFTILDLLNKGYIEEVR